MKKSIWTFGSFLALCAATPAAAATAGVPAILVGDTSAPEAIGVQMIFQVAVNPPSSQQVTVNYATSDGTAVAGEDYVAASGSITIPVSGTGAQVAVTILVDGVDEPDEMFSLTLSNPVGAVIGDGTAVATIVDGNPPPGLGISDCYHVEGGGQSPCQFTVYVLAPTAKTVTVDYATIDGTAHDPFDYHSTSGTITFPPGIAALPFDVIIQGDAANELDENYFVTMTNPVNAQLQDQIGEGVILNDDGPDLAGQELTHGAVVKADLAAAGPLANPDFYRVPQGPYTSWEVVADEVSGDIAPGLVLERLAEDKITVLQTGTAVGMGSAQALRWQRRAATADVRPFIRVRSTGCTTGCGADDVYRLRAYETTARIPRFNNSATQATVLIFQNTTSAAIAGNADFWAPDGTLLATAPLTLAPSALSVVNTGTIAALAGKSGSVTVTHDGPYGALAGKAVALEPATGFSFDSPLESKPR